MKTATLPPITVPIDADYSARVDRRRHPFCPTRVTIYHQGRKVVVAPWHELTAAYGKIARALQETPTPGGQGSPQE